MQYATRKSGRYPSQHDGFVVAAHPAVDFHFISTKIACQIRTAEFVIESCAANRCGQHDVECGGNVSWLAISVGFPGLYGFRNPQVETLNPVSPALGFAPDPVAPSSRISPPPRWLHLERGNRRRVVMCFYFGQPVCQLRCVAILIIFSGVKPLDDFPFQNCGIIRIGNDRVLGMALMGMPNHAKQRMRLLYAIDYPVGIENLVPAMFELACANIISSTSVGSRWIRVK